jgi:hypothetical protein
MEGQFTVVYGFMWKQEGLFQGTVVYKNAFWRKGCDWAYDNLKTWVFLYTFFGGWLQNLEGPAAEAYIQMECTSD